MPIVASAWVLSLGMILAVSLIVFRLKGGGDFRVFLRCPPPLCAIKPVVRSSLSHCIIWLFLIASRWSVVSWSRMVPSVVSVWSMVSWAACLVVSWSVLKCL